VALGEPCDVGVCGKSVEVARRAGFVHEGTMRSHGVWQHQRCDVMWFAALPLEWTVDEANERT
jgi:RimJ/RimL family protein N-acetyltransferase